MAKDYYATLGVDKSATKDEIKKAYRKLAAKHHPDTGGDETKFKEINEAYSILSDDQKKSNYDNFGSAKGPSYSSSRDPFSDMFRGASPFSDFFNQEDIFNSFNRARTKSKKQRNLGINILYNIDFFDAIHGKDAKIKFNRDEICPDCNGQGGKDVKICPVCQGMGSIQTRHGFATINQTCNRCQGSGQVVKEKCQRCDGKKYVKTIKTINIKIPPGTNNNDKLRIKQQGHQSKNGFGDLIVSIGVKPHEYFERHGNDILIVIPLTITQVMLGATITVPTIHSKANVKIKPGIQPGKAGDFILRMRGMGVNGGDQIVVGRLKIPNELSEKEKEILESLEKEIQSKTSPEPIRIKDL